MINDNLMIDLETLATTPDATILSVGAVRFNLYGNELVAPAMESFYVKVDLDSCDKLGLAVSESTIEWWSKQDPAAQEEVFSSGGDRVDVGDAMIQLYKFSKGIKRVWSNGAGFDVPICETVYRKIERAYPWQYWQVRDVRTIFDLGINPAMPKTLKHHALEDAKNQAIAVQNVFRVLRAKGLEIQ